MIKSEKKRIVWIDQLRGFAFYFVILGHMNIQRDLKVWIYSFHMPLFFIISGFNLDVEKIYKTDFKSYISHLAKRMLVPYFWLQLLALGLKYLYYFLARDREINVTGYLGGIFAGHSSFISAPTNPMYFVLLLFLAQVFLWFVIKLTKGNKWLSFAVVAALTSISVLTRGQPMPWHINVAPIGMLFMFIGRLLMDGYMSVHKKLRKLRLPYYLSFCVILLVIGAVVSDFNGKASIHANHYGKNYIVYLISAVVTSVAFMLLVMLIPPVKIFKFIGMNTIFLLGIHSPVLVAAEGLFPDFADKGWFIAVASVVCHFLPVPVLWLVRKTMPYICGNVIKDKSIVTEIFKFVAVALVFAAPYASFTKTFLDGALREETPGKIISAVIFAAIVAGVTILLNRVSSVAFLESKKNSEAVERKPVVYEDEGIMIIIPVEEV